MIGRVRTVLILVVALSVAGCRSPGSTERSTEVARVRSGDLDVVLLSQEPAIKRGRDTITIEFRRASNGSLVDVGTVTGHATMPMAGMAPMLGRIDIQRGDLPGRYTAISDLGMAGEWRLGLEWNGPDGEGSATVSTSAQ